MFTSGENILVSVNFNNSQLNRTPTTPPIHRKSDSKERNLEPKEVVDITTKKKVDMKPVAIIDLARSPFKVMTPEDNIIELSDSDNEKNNQIKSPDFQEDKLYDPFEVLQSPTDNVTSSYETFGNDVTTSAAQQQASQQSQQNTQTQQLQPQSKDDHMNDQSVISIFNSTITSIPCL